MLLLLQAVAFGKLQGVLDSKPLNLPGKNLLNLSMLAAVLTCGGLFLTTPDPGFGVAMLWATAGIGGVLGAHLTASIGESSMTHKLGGRGGSAALETCFRRLMGGCLRTAGVTAVGPWLLNK
jgi:NAD/NADP transhydrogenase beta subunit